MQTKNRQVIKISKFIQKKSITRKLVRSQIYANGKGSNKFHGSRGIAKNMKLEMKKERNNNEDENVK